MRNDVAEDVEHLLIILILFDMSGAGLEWKMKQIWQQMFRWCTHCILYCTTSVEEDIVMNRNSSSVFLGNKG